MSTEKEALEQGDETVVAMTVEVRIMATKKMHGLFPDDVEKYLGHHMEIGIEAAVKELQSGSKSTRELGFS